MNFETGLIIQGCQIGLIDATAMYLGFLHFDRLLQHFVHRGMLLYKNGNNQIY